jgi:hypothetical protein
MYWAARLKVVYSVGMPKRPLAGTLAMPTMTPRLSFSSNVVPIFGF